MRISMLVSIKVSIKGWYMQLLIQGDCLEVLKTLPDNSVDSIVTDPPAGISFMGKDWDKDKGGRTAWIAWMSKVAAECLRVIKPGGHALVWAIPRTSHWTGMAWEDAGWQPRDKVYHTFATGFPKSADISKHIDKKFGAERVCTRTGSIKRDGYGDDWDTGSSNTRPHYDIPATESAQQWNGWGTALKPAVEEWWLFRKPLSESTVAGNVLKWGTGALHIDACRVGNDTITTHGRRDGSGNSLNWSNTTSPDDWSGSTHQGRWPAHFTHDGSDEVKETFPSSKSTVRVSEDKDEPGATRSLNRKGTTPRGHADSGSAARYFSELQPDDEDLELRRVFYHAKASKKDRDEGLEDITNKHPTVKNTTLMRWLCKLITPPGGVVLDPFTGSGSTGKAAVLEGFDFIGIEYDQEYLEIAKRRIEHVMEGN